VRLTNPGDQTGTVGGSASLQIKASASDNGTLRYDATGLPPSLSIDRATGLIQGPLNAGGTYPVTVTASELGGPPQSISFSWTVNEVPQFGPVTPIPVRQMPGSAWSVGINDSALAIPAHGDRVIASTCESTADLATDPLAQLIETNATVDWAAPAKVDHATWGCPPAVTDWTQRTCPVGSTDTNSNVLNVVSD
jgi:hypothetical protein